MRSRAAQGQCDRVGHARRDSLSFGFFQFLSSKIAIETRATQRK